MGSNEPVYRTSCIQCGQPALTFDREGHSFCKEHAQEFIPAVREPEPEEEAEDW